MSIHGRTGAVATAARTAALLFLATSAVAVVMVPTAAPGAALPQSATSEATAAGPVRPPFKVATFNVLFASHTDGRHPRRAAFAHSTVRTERAVKLFRRSGIDVAGLQELQRPARRTFRRLAPDFGIFAAGTRSVVWRKDDFAFVDAHTIRTRTYRGRLARTPVVTLRQRATGQHVVVMSVHNPADTRGPAGAFRDEATRQQLAEALRHRRTADPVPLLVLGDMNARAKFVCPFTASGEMHAAAGGTHVNGSCEVPSFKKGIDWIMGSTDVVFSRFRDDYDTRRATDHPLITAVARIAR
ncbi:endonuclease/exonuclease/phosphatase family protein [Nocardioides lacusdianchii]|uniref:endonuclease/exonuclease/phosphatase family protein n=1 Tax=Nocardioides lacusdianchii TaxID=2783664 RepID=UPI001CCF0BF8|nr:endonuclease/exonuclease/phosphatase family protein [Nocardioides lacusdianchii]